VTTPPNLSDKPGQQVTGEDAEHKRQEDRQDTALALTNTRDDAETKRDEDREDTALALANTRWDTEHKRDEDRQDTADALTHTREDAALAAEWTLFEAVHAGYIAVAQNTLDRSMQRGTYIVTAAGAVATLYTTLLGLRFSSAVQTTPLPARGILPALFLGGAVVFSTFYISFLRQRRMASELLPSGLGGRIAQARLESFIEWVTAGAVARAWALRVAVISFGLGLILLPVTFVQLSSDTVTALGVTAAAILALWMLGEFLVAVAGPPRWLDRALASNRRRSPYLQPNLPPPPPAWYPPGPPADPYASVPLAWPPQAGDQPCPQDQPAAGQPPGAAQDDG
jgi:hypothetical protein